MRTRLISARDRRLTAAAALVAAGALTLAGCGSDTTTDQAPPSEQTTSAGSSPLALARQLEGDEQTAKDDTAGRATDTSDKVSSEPDQATPPRLTVTEIRVGEHEGADRVVYQLEGTGGPGFEVGYVDAPSQQGSGHALEVDGDSFLQVLISGQALPMENGVAEVPVGMVSTDEASGVAGVAFSGQFEGRAQSVIGLKGSDRAFTVFTLQNPTRLVVDIAR